MCIGLPMQIERVGDGMAKAERYGETFEVNIQLVADAEPGDWVLVHLHRAVRKLDPVEARDIDAALQALDLALGGENVDHLFADLVDREPQLPPHLRNLN